MPFKANRTKRLKVIDTWTFETTIQNNIPRGIEVCL